VVRRREGFEAVKSVGVWGVGTLNLDMVINQHKKGAPQRKNAYTQERPEKAAS